MCNGQRSSKRLQQGRRRFIAGARGRRQHVILTRIVAGRLRQASIAVMAWTITDTAERVQSRVTIFVTVLAAIAGSVVERPIYDIEIVNFDVIVDARDQLGAAVVIGRTFIAGGEVLVPGRAWQAGRSRSQRTQHPSIASAGFVGWVLIKSVETIRGWSWMLDHPLLALRFGGRHQCRQHSAKYQFNDLGRGCPA